METKEVERVEIPRAARTAAGISEGEFPEYVREAVAVSLYRSGKVSLGKAVELAGLPSRWEAMALLKRYGAWFDLRAEDIVEDADTLGQLLGP